jgi:hypothetical protein
MFIAGNPSLDFLNSIGTPADTVVEWLGNGEDLLAWLEQSELVPPEAAATIRANCFPGELDAVAAHARALREWFRGFVLAHRGHSLGPHSLRELEPLNRILERDDAYGAIVAGPVDAIDRSAKSDLSGVLCVAGVRQTPCFCRSRTEWPTSLRLKIFLG